MKEHEIGTLRTKKRPQTLSGTQKGNFFKTSFQFFKEWEEKSDEGKQEINPMERMGIYCIVFSMLEDRLETLWWNCSYVHKWDVIEKRVDGVKTKRPPNEYEHRNRKIPKGIRTTGRFRNNLLEICTSDTHYSVVKARNRNGYYQLGLITSADKLSKWFSKIAENAQSNITSTKYQILENETKVKVMGKSIYEDYSKALENSLKITKIFVICSLGLFITSLFL